MDRATGPGIAALPCVSEPLVSASVAEEERLAIDGARRPPAVPYARRRGRIQQPRPEAALEEEGGTESGFFFNETMASGHARRCEVQRDESSGRAGRETRKEPSRLGRGDLITIALGSFLFFFIVFRFTLEVAIVFHRAS